MGHYDSSRPGYCGACGAAPGNMRKDGSCKLCKPRRMEAAEREKERITAEETFAQEQKRLKKEQKESYKEALATLQALKITLIARPMRIDHAIDEIHDWLVVQIR